MFMTESKTPSASSHTCWSFLASTDLSSRPSAATRVLTDANVRNRWVVLQKEDRQAGTQRTRRVSLWLEVAVSSSDAAKLCLGHLLAAEYVKASVASYRNERSDSSAGWCTGSYQYVFSLLSETTTFGLVVWNVVKGTPALIQRGPSSQFSLVCLSNSNRAHNWWLQR